MATVGLMLSDEQREFQVVLREMFAAVCPPDVVRSAKQSADAAKPSELWKALTGMGVFGLTTESRFGGEDASLIELALVFHEAGRVVCPSTVTSSLLFGFAVGALGSDKQKEAWLRPLANGEVVATTALWDASNPRRAVPRLRAHRDAAGWSVSGELMFVQSAASADVMLLSAAAGGQHELTRVLGVLVPPGAAGVRIEPLRTISDTGQCRAVLDHCRVDANQLVSGPDSAGLDIADIQRLASVSVALQCSAMVGGADAVIEQTVAYVKDRHQFGRPLASFQALQHQVANVTIARELASVLTNQAVSRLHRGLDAGKQVAAAKMHCSEMYKRATMTAHQLHGAIGFMREANLHLWSERAKEAELLGGSADLAAAWLADDLQLAH